MATKIDLCDSCKATGLSMHVALVLPAPAGCGSPALPAWVATPSVVSVALSGYQYTLRSLRAGYLYAFFKKCSRGRNRWQAWDVSADGQAFPMANPAWAIPVADMLCKRTGHSPARLHHIVLEDPHLCETAWIAFSEHQWSDDTLKRYAADEKLRGERMLKFEPAQLIASDAAKSESIVPATVAALEAIADYNPSFDAAKLPFGIEQAKLPNISTNEGGAFDPAKLALQSTRYPWAPGRKGTAAKACDTLMLRSRKKDGTPHPGVVVALPDAVGCTHEMNGYRNDVAGRIAQYGQERELQLSALTAIQGLQQALEGRAGQVARDASETGTFKWTGDNTAKRMKNVQAQYPNDAARVRREQDLCGRWERDGQQQIPAHIARQREFYVSLSEADWLKYQAQVDQQAAKYTTPTKTTGNSVVQQRETRSKEWEKNAVAGAWPKYKEKIDPKTFDAFKAKWDELQAAADKLIDARTEQLIKWLEAPAFLTALEDFHPQNLDDGVAFDDKVGSAIMGMASSKAGRTKIDAWVKEMQAKKTNLVWRAVARNQTEGIAALNEALAHAQSGLNVVLTAQSWAATTANVKWSKIGDLYKKGQSVSNTLIKASAPNSGMKSASMAGVDKLLVTVGDRVLGTAFAKKVDSVISEKIVEAVFLIRAGAHVDDVLELVETKAKVECTERWAMMRRIYGAQAFASVLDDGTGKLRPTAQVLTEKWNKLAANASKADDTGRFNAAKDSRLAFVVALLEAYNLAKCGYDAGTKQDAKSMVVLGSGVLSMSAAAVDVYTNVVKGMLDESSVTFQRFKLLGGALSGVASIGSGVASLIDMKAAVENTQYGMAALNFSSFVATSAGGLANFAATFSYCQPYFLAAAERQAVSGLAMRAAATGVAAQAAKKLVLYRATLMVAGLGLNIVALGIQAAIWHYSDDELQAWCEKCAFGTKRDKDWSAKLQQEALYKATYLIGLTR
jgi:hypothetical protein